MTTETDQTNQPSGEDLFDTELFIGDKVTGTDRTTAGTITAISGEGVTVTWFDGIVTTDRSLGRALIKAS